MPDDPRPEPSDDTLLAMLRGVTAVDAVLDAPPASVWAGIEHGVRAGATPVVAASVPRVATASVPTAAAAPVPSVVARRHPWGRLVAAAAAVGVLAGIVGVVANRTDRRSTVQLAAARLSSAGLPGAPAGLTGDARVIERGGKEYLHVDAVRVAPKSGEYLELWLIDTNVKGMVSLGIVDHGGDYELPPGLRYSDYPIVDISTEPYDGKPTHSGDSLLRGKLA